MGEVHENTRPALAMLRQEGFDFNGFVDIFDAGPIVECFVRNVRAVRESSLRQTLVAKHAPQVHDDSDYFLVSNCGLENFRATLVTREAVTYDTVSLSPEHARLLGVGMSDPLRVIPLRYKENI